MLIINSRKPVLIAILGAVCIATFFWFSAKNSPSILQQSTALPAMDSEDTAQTKRLQTESLILPAAAVQAGLGKQLTVREPEWPTVMGSPANKAEIQNWFRSRGYEHGGEGNNEYQGYTIETLGKLAQSGDVRAMKYWGDAIYGTVGGFEKAKYAYVDAALHGSTDAIDAIAMIMKISLYSNAKTAEEKQQIAVEVLAWYNTAALRGDKWPNIVGAENFIRIYDLNLSDQDQEKIQARSQEIYNDLLQNRRALGLGDFDNSVPDSVNRYFEFLEGK